MMTLPTQSMAAMQLKQTGLFADEEVDSTFTYPKGYKVKEISEQVRILRGLFPNIGYAEEKLADPPAGELPPNAEGCFAILRWETLAKTYNEAVEKLFAAFASKYKFHNYREGKLDPKYLRQHEGMAKRYQKLAGASDSEILVVPCQFGFRHKGRSIRRALEVMSDFEFGLGTFASACMLLTHPEREVKWKQLHVLCAGDEVSPGGGGRFLDAPLFTYSDDRIKYNIYWSDSAYERHGSASGFLPLRLRQ
jgi:hypothetical protein